MPPTELHCTVKTFKWLTPTVYELTFEPDKPIDFKAGQYISIVIPGAGPEGRDLRRAYSIASAPHVRPIELCVKLVDGGPGTNYLHSLREGGVFRGFMAYGHFVYHPKPGRRACFVSTGTGLAPFRAMVQSREYAAAPPSALTTLLGVRTESELLYEADFAKVANATWVPAVSKPEGEWPGFRGRVTDWLRAQGPEFPWGETEFYLCGNGAMITEGKALLLEKGVAKESIHQEIYFK